MSHEGQLRRLDLRSGSPRGSHLGAGAWGVVDDYGAVAAMSDATLNCWAGGSHHQVHVKAPAHVAIGGARVATLSATDDGAAIELFSVPELRLGSDSPGRCTVSDPGGLAIGADRVLAWGLGEDGPAVNLLTAASWPEPAWEGDGAPSDWQGWALAPEGELLSWGCAGVDFAVAGQAVRRHVAWPGMERVAVSPGTTTAAWVPNVAGDDGSDRPVLFLGDLRTGACRGPTPLPLPPGRLSLVVSDHGVVWLAALAGPDDLVIGRAVAGEVATVELRLVADSGY